MHSSRIGFVWLAFAAGVLATGCGPGDYYRSPPIGGVRFFANAGLTGGVGETLRVQVSAHNRGRRLRQIDAGGCGDALLVRVTSPVKSGAAWDSKVWREAEISALNARRDTTPKGRPIIYGACAPVAITRELAPHDSGAIAAVTIPVRAVLGDSLPPGRYRIETRLFGNGWKAGQLTAGEVELRLPPT